MTAIEKIRVAHIVRLAMQYGKRQHIAIAYIANAQTRPFNTIDTQEIIRLERLRDDTRRDLLLILANVGITTLRI